MPSGDNRPYSDVAGSLLGAPVRAVAPLFGAGVQATAQRQARWKAYNRDELESFLDLTEHKLRRAGREIEELRIDNAKLRAAQRHIAVRRITERPGQY